MWPSISSSMGTVARNAQFEVEIFHLPQGKRVTRTACGGTAPALKASKNPEAGGPSSASWPPKSSSG